MGNQQVPDVRVRLSAEGVDEVVRAFQQVAAAAKKSGTDSAKGFGLLKGALSELSGLLPAIGFAGAVVGLGSMVKNALESADAIGKLSEKTGLSTETLSTLSFAADMVGVNFEALSKGLFKFNKMNGDLESGLAQASLKVKELFGSETALNGLNTDQRFAKVATAIGKLPAGFQKTTDAMNFFSRRGAELIPLFNEIATQGFDKIEKKALSLGLVIDEKTSKAAERAVESFKLLKDEAQGAALQFTEGLAPAVADAMTSVSDSLASGGQNGFQVAGSFVGELVKDFADAAIRIGLLAETIKLGWVLAIAGISDSVKTSFGNFVTEAKATGLAIKRALSGDFSGAGAALDAMNAQIAAANAGLKDREAIRREFAQARVYTNAETLSALQRHSIAAPAPGGGNGDATKSTAETSKALIALQQQRLQNELALFKQYDALNAARTQQQYQEGLVSLSDYFDGRKAAINASSTKEIAELQKERDLLATSPIDLLAGASDDKVQAAKLVRRKAVEALDAKIAQAGVARDIALNANDTARFNAELAFEQKRLQIEDQIKTAEGDIHGAAIDAINAEAAALKRLGLPPELIAQWQQSQVAAADFAESARQGQQAVAGLGDVQAAIQNEVDSGQIFPFQAVQQYNDAVVAALPHLRELAAVQLAAARTPAEIQQAEQFANQIDHMAIAADTAAVRMGEFKKSLESALTSDLTTFFSQGIDQARGFGDAVRLMAASVVNSLRQIAAQMLATLLVQKALSAFSAGSAVGSAIQIAGEVAGGAVVAATGGIITGPGTGTSDSIPARLSHGEFVVRAASVQQPGVLPLLAAINRGMGSPSLRSFGVPRFANGGIVNGSSQGSPADGVDHTLTVGLEDGLIAKHMSTPSGRRAMLTQIANNPKAFRAALKL